jgi:hypothetical protein
MNIGIESSGDVDEPSRDPKTGHFLPGNKASQGNPQAKKVAALRSAILDASTTDDVQRVMRSLLRMAQNDNVYAAREWLDRVVGKPVDTNPQQNNSLVVQLLQQNEQDRILLESPEARQLAGQWQRMIANKRDDSPANIDGGDE